MRGLLTTLLLALIVAGAAAWAEDEGPASATLTFPDAPELFVSFEPSAGPVRVQRQIVLRIRIVSARPFEALSLTKPEGDAAAEIFELSAPRTRSVRSYAADGFVHEASYAIFPLRSGPMRAPSIRASGRVSGPGGGTGFDLSVPGPALDILAAPASWAEPGWMIADSIEIDESWSVPPDRLRRGDVVRRTVTVSARGAPADRMEPPVHAAARGMEIHEAGIEARTVRSADGLTGVMTRSWDIVIGDAPVINIPPVRVAFWDAAKDAPGLRAARARRIEPAEPDREARAAALMAEAATERRGARLMASLVALLVALPGLAFAAAFVKSALPTGEDLRLRAACRRASGPAAALRAIEAWKRETGLRAEGCAPVSRLEAALFGDAGGGDPRRAAAALLSLGRGARQAELARRIGAAADSLLGRVQSLDIRAEDSATIALRFARDSS